MNTRAVERPRRLTAALAEAAFRRLLAVRLVSQFGDGVFQAGLAGAVLFNPERQAHAADIAAGFTVLLLPYSLIGPFAGVLLDRWWRQRVLFLANVVRAAAVVGVAAEVAVGLGGLPFYTSALVVISIGRFVLSALSAAQPLVVADDLLVTANALAVTAGTLAATAGAGVAIGIRTMLGDTNGDYAVIAVSAAVPYLVAAAVAARFRRSDLGPTHAQRQLQETAAQVFHGLVAGIRLVASVRPVATAYAAITVHRICFGVWTVCAVLLYRNYLSAAGPFRAGLGGLAQVLAAVAVGGGVAALVTPAAFRRLGPVRWPAAMLAISAALEVGLVLPYAPGLLVLSGLLLGFASQAVKISVDTITQQYVADAFRGRVFAIYDMLFNVALVVAAVLTAVAIPESGHSPAAVFLVGAGWAAAAAGYLIRSRRTTTSAR